LVARLAASRRRRKLPLVEHLYDDLFVLGLVEFESRDGK